LAEARLKWRPLGLLSGAVVVEEIAADTGVLKRTPRLPETEKPQESPVPESFSITLPKAQIQSIRINNFSIDEGVAGVAATLNASGLAMTSPQNLKAALTLSSTSNEDIIRTNIDLDPKAATSSIEIDLKSSETGLISTLAQAQGPVSATITGEGPATALPLKIDANIGALAAATLNAETSYREKELSTDIDGAVTLGEALAGLHDLAGEEIELALTAVVSPKAMTVDIKRLSTLLASLAGQASVALSDSGLSGATATIDLTPTDEARTRYPFLEKAGDSIDLKANLKPSPNDIYAAEIAVNAAFGQVQVTEAETDLAKNFKGALRAEINGLEDLSPLLAGRTALSAQVDAVVEERATLKNISLRLSDQTVLTGDAALNLTDNTVSSDIKLTAPAALLTKAVSGAQAQAPFTSTIQASGSIDNLSLALDGAVPAFVLDAGETEAATFSAKLSGLPERPSGRIEARATEGVGALNAVLQTSASGEIQLSELIASGAKFKITGDGSFDPSNDLAIGKLVFQGDDGAVLFPGLIASGDLNAAFRMGANDDANSVDVSAPRLTVSDLSLRDLLIEGKGPSSNLSVAARFAQAQFGETPARDFSTLAALDLTKSAARIENLSLKVDAIPVELEQAADVRFADGFAIEGFKALIGAKGRLSADAAFGQSRWQATLKANEIVAPSAPIAITASLNLDTDQQERASGAFSIANADQRDAEASLSGTLQWLGDRLVVKDAGEIEGVDFRIDAPLALTRTPALGVDTTGALNGAITFDGPVATLIALAPGVEGLEGVLKADIAIAGTTAAPEASGDITLTDGAYMDPATGLSLIGVNFEAAARSSAGATTATFSGGARGPGQTAETISLSGSAQAGEDVRFDADVILDGAVFQAALVKALDVSGDIKVDGGAERISAKGALDIARLEVELEPPTMTGLVPIDIVTEDASGGDPTILSTERKKTPPANAPLLDLDITINADDRLFVRGLGLDSEWQSALRVVTLDNAPAGIGDITLRRGAFDFSGRRFTIETGRIILDRLAVNNPVLDIRAEYQTEDDVIAALVVSGRAMSPEIGLESTPSLPQEDVMALILFGKPATELGPTESLQMAQALASLSGLGPFGGGPGLTGSARDALGLDMLNLDLDPQNGGSALTVGKYVADGVFVSATQDVRGENGAVRVEYEVTNNISVETQLRQDGDQRVSANWKRDF
ncbi:MAG: translocation/assembly module TamB domain-containing protein, partial [Pseudomonadota bacterium]